ncbi:NADH-quinone oxidoreductase subunit C [Fulvivirga sp. M361]|uniref:NADH-quinone oxidoreductase subunit C n=1 Tax=Fulvivirga sp. M361 TaxID=2594266 RepID=UPI00117BC28C|nr:NADH-quinone oxidoreductase subunit C [Fulvivirga sp. M361]TRX57744.1 NADH-quinone oxidoreductase subunit C [Fulvivirga sp. M361]
MQLEDIIKILENKLDKTSFLTIDEQSSPTALIVPDTDLRSVCQVLFEDSKLYFDMLSCISGIDNGVEANTFEVAYNLYSIPFDFQLMLKVILDRENAKIDTISDIWKTANWHERETYDLFGITFEGHPDLRRILLPADWEGYPLRKDYKHQEYYRGIKVEY